MNELYQLLLNAWAEECGYQFGRTLPMNIITDTGCGHAVAEGEKPLTLLNGDKARKFIITYYLEKGTTHEETAIN